MTNTQGFETGKRYEFHEDSEGSDLLDPIPSDLEPKPKSKAPKTFRKNSKADLSIPL